MAGAMAVGGAASARRGGEDGGGKEARRTRRAGALQLGIIVTVGCWRYSWVLVGYCRYNWRVSLQLGRLQHGRSHGTRVSSPNGTPTVVTEC